MKPMPFKADMVQAIRESRKTVTRRVIKPQPPATCHIARRRFSWTWSWWEDGDAHYFEQPYNPGEIVYVPEAWRCRGFLEGVTDKTCSYDVIFKDGGVELFYFDSRERFEKWKKYYYKPEAQWQSPYFMPREAARLFLRITGVRVEQLQDIENVAGCRAEGIWDDYKASSWEHHEALATMAYPKLFSELWDSTIKPKDRERCCWAANPWVWVIEFERISKEEALK